MTENVRTVKAKVISQTGHCELGHKVGDTVTFTETHACPDADNPVVFEVTRLSE